MEIQVTYDHGSSLVKSIATVNGNAFAISMEPEIIKLPVSSLKSHTDSAGGVKAALPEDNPELWRQAVASLATG